MSKAIIIAQIICKQKLTVKKNSQDKQRENVIVTRIAEEEKI